MGRIYRLSRIGKKLIYKVRHHKGHGVHSPFVFSFINNVIEQKDAYYAYDDINMYLNNYPFLQISDDKINKLSFRVTNYFSPKKILELGGGIGVNTLYITSVASDIDCVSVELDATKYSEAETLYKNWYRRIVQTSEPFPVMREVPDCIFLNLINFNADTTNLIEYLFSLVKSNSFIFIDGIRINKSKQALWKKLIKDNRVKISMDLFEVGILLFDNKYIKQNYKLSF